jgi:hypothetical protein
MDGVRTRNPVTFDDLFDPVQLCVHGVCLAAAHATLQGALGTRPFAVEAKCDELTGLPAGLRPRKASAARTP